MNKRKRSTNIYDIAIPYSVKKHQDKLFIKYIKCLNALEI